MAKRVIVDYRIEWKLVPNKGRIGVKLEGSDTFLKIRLSNYEEFLALISVLQGPKPVYYDSKRRVIATM